MKTARIFSIVLLLLTGVAAIFGGGSLVLDSSGAGLGFPPDLLDRTSFDSYLVPGLILFFLIGVSSLATAVLTIMRHRLATTLIVLEGVIICVWIGAQMFLLQTIEPIQIAVGGIGFTLFCLGLFQQDEEPVGPESEFTE